MTATPAVVASSTLPSGTCCQSSSSSDGSEATITAAGAGAGSTASRPAAVAAMTCAVGQQQVEPAGSARCPDVGDRAGEGIGAGLAFPEPGLHHAPRSALCRSEPAARAGRPPGRRPASAGSTAAAAPVVRAACRGRPADEGPVKTKKPLALGVGRGGGRSTSVPTDADRTAHSIARVVVTRARSGRQSSAQIGPLRRYLAGIGSSSAYQPTPKPSTFIVPCRCRRGAHACSTQAVRRVEQDGLDADRRRRGTRSAGTSGKSASRAVRNPAKICRLIG